MENMFSNETAQQAPSMAPVSVEEFKLEEGETIHDDCFVVRESRHGLWNSTTVKGRKVLCALTEEVCIDMTRWHLKMEQEGWPEGSTLGTYSGTVGGKL